MPLLSALIGFGLGIAFGIWLCATNPSLVNIFKPKEKIVRKKEERPEEALEG